MDSARDIRWTSPRTGPSSRCTATSTCAARGRSAPRSTTSSTGLDDEVVVDLADVDNIDVTALRVLAVATRQAWLTGHHLTVRNCGPAVRRMMHLTRLARAIEVERAVASA